MPSSRAKTATVRIGAAARRTALAALAQPTPHQQIHELSAAVEIAGPLGEAALAAQLLAACGSDTPEPTRSYLAAVAGLGTADALFAYAGTLPRGRSFLWNAVTTVWDRAKDGDALEAAFGNFTHAFADDPNILPIGVAAAKRRRDVVALADRKDRLARARRINTIINQLSGDRSGRARGATMMAKLRGADRIHLYERIVASPGGIETRIVLAALAAQLAQPDQSEMFLVEAVRVNPHRDRVTTLLLERAAKPAVLARLVRMFESTWSWVDGADVLAVYVPALAANRTHGDVRAMVARGASTKNAIVRAAIRGLQKPRR